MSCIALQYHDDSNSIHISNKRLTDANFKKLVFEVIKTMFLGKEISLITLDYNDDSLGRELPNISDIFLRNRKFLINRIANVSINQLSLLLLEDFEFWIGRIWICGQAFDGTFSANEFLESHLFRASNPHVELIRCYDYQDIVWHYPHSKPEILLPLIQKIEIEVG